MTSALMSPARGPLRVSLCLTLTHPWLSPSAGAGCAGQRAVPDKGLCLGWQSSRPSVCGCLSVVVKLPRADSELCQPGPGSHCSAHKVRARYVCEGCAGLTSDTQERDPAGTGDFGAGAVALPASSQAQRWLKEGCWPCGGERPSTRWPRLAIRQNWNDMGLDWPVNDQLLVLWSRGQDPFPASGCEDRILEGEGVHPVSLGWVLRRSPPDPR